MTDHRIPPRGACTTAGVSVPLVERTPERLVGLGFRHWMAGFQTGDVAHWEHAWALYSDALGPDSARLAVSELASWVKAVSACARRDITVAPCSVRGFCRDECLAVSMIAACQYDTCPAQRACTLALIDSRLVGEVTHHAESFGTVLRCLDQMLSPQSIGLADIAGGTPAALLH